MGAITDVLLVPVMAPVWGFRFVLEQLRDEADAVLRDEGRAFAELSELSLRRTTGQLSDAEYAEQEAQLLDRLSTIRDLRDSLADDVDEDETLMPGPDLDEAPGELPVDGEEW